jgi:hypothetical protein
MGFLAASSSALRGARTLRAGRALAGAPRRARAAPTAATAGRGLSELMDMRKGGGGGGKKKGGSGGGR